MLIDYNSVWAADELGTAVGFSVKENYSAPEVRLQDFDEVSAASDLFSVCAIFYEYLRREPLSFAALYSGEKVTGEEMPLLNGVPAAAVSKAMAILRKGLRLSPNRRYQSAAELKIDFVDLLQELTRVRRKSLAVKASAALLFVLLAVSAVIFFNPSYPRGTNELNASENAMTAVTDSLTRLGWQMESDLILLDNYREPAAWRGEMPRGASWSADGIIAALGPRSPIPNAVLRELLNAPREYAEWSDAMKEKLPGVLGEESVYPLGDREDIKGLYKAWIDSYANNCFIQLQLTVLPLNADGKKPILDALPYLPVFREMFLTRAFGTDSDELESVLETETERRNDITVRLRAYGL
jgi:hypothetical protein